MLQDEILRDALGWWLGYGPAARPTLDDALALARARRSVVVTGPPGAMLDDLAVWLAAEPLVRALVPNGANAQRVLAERAAGRTLLVAGDLPHDVRGLRGALHADGAARLIVVAATPATADDLARAADLAPDTAIVRVPALAERPADRERLITEAGLRAAFRLGVGVPDLGEAAARLAARAWPGELAELARTVEIVVAARALGSLRRAAAALGAGKSTLADTLARVGIEPPGGHRRRTARAPAHRRPPSRKHHAA
jgi:hypothetical protein